MHQSKGIILHESFPLKTEVEDTKIKIKEYVLKRNFKEKFQEKCLGSHYK